MNEIEQRRFSWIAWVGGLILVLIIGLPLNFYAGLFFLSNAGRLQSVLVELIPGVLVALISWRRRRLAFAHGALVGGCLVALVGGLCGYAIRDILKF